MTAANDLPSAVQIGRERFGPDFAMNERGESICEDCGELLLYGRHLHGQACSGTKCLKCRRLGLKGHPCVHETKSYFVTEADGWHPLQEELAVWLP